MLLELRLWVIIVINSCFSVIYAQQPEDMLWHKGYLVLESKDTLQGLLMYDFRNNFIQFQKGEEYRFFLPGRFTSGYYESSVDSTVHYFSVFDMKTAADYYRPNFFEIVDTTGFFKIVMQYYWIQQMGTYSQFNPMQTYTRKVVYLFYLDAQKIARNIRLNKKFIIKLLDDKKDLVKKFAIENHLYYNYYTDVIQIFKYYNSLK